MAQGDWYYCLDHHTVEPYEACRSETRLGPYPTAADAAHALEKVAQLSPWTPSLKAVTSIFRMSPSASGRESGMPWQITSFTDVQQDLG